MSTFDRFFSEFWKGWDLGDGTGQKRRVLPPVTYPTLQIVENAPRNHELTNGVITIVAPGGQPRWCMLLCPCGCGTAITLSLNLSKHPHWEFASSKSGRPTLWPSIWRDIGCFSHFVIEDGRVHWCSKGISPEEARASWTSKRED